MNRLNYYTVEDQYNLPTKENINLLEKELGFKLPLDYKNFLCSYALSAFSGYVIFPFKDDYPYDDSEYLNVFFGILPNSAYDILENYHDYKGRISSTLLPIANNPGGSIICISIDTNDMGAIYFWDIVDETLVEEGKAIDSSNVYLVANSFDDFINSLEIEQDEDDEDF